MKCIEISGSLANKPACRAEVRYCTWLKSGCLLSCHRMLKMGSSISISWGKWGCVKTCPLFAGYESHVNYTSYFGVTRRVPFWPKVNMAIAHTIELHVEWRKWFQICSPCSASESETNGRNWSTSRIHYESESQILPHRIRNASNIAKNPPKIGRVRESHTWLIKHTRLSLGFWLSFSGIPAPFSFSSFSSPQIQNGIAVVGTGLVGRLLTKCCADFGLKLDILSNPWYLFFPATNNVLLVKIEGPVWYTIYHQTNLLLKG